MSKQLVSNLESYYKLCEKLRRALNQFESTLIREANAVGRSDLAELESITQEKTVFASTIEKYIASLGDLSDQILYKDLGIGESESNRFKNVSDIISPIREHLKPDRNSELEVLLVKVENSIDELKSLRKTLHPRIEANAYLVKKLLEYHRDVYAFWMNTLGETESVYSNTGKSKAGQQRSILTVRT